MPIQKAELNLRFVEDGYISVCWESSCRAVTSYIIRFDFFGSNCNNFPTEMLKLDKFLGCGHL